MFAWFRQRKKHQRIADDLYGRIVAQAREPQFYGALGVPDSLEGRYEMVVAHLVLVIERLRADGAPHQNLARTLVERFVTDMDDSMRELGIGDTSVPKKVKGAAAGLVERTARYREAIAAGPAEIAKALRTSLNDTAKPDAAASSTPDTRPPDSGPTDTDLAIAAYIAASAKALAGKSLEDMLSANPLFAPLNLTPGGKP